MAAASSSGLSPVEERVLVLCAQNPDGITNKMLEESEPQLSAQDCVSAINGLLAKGKLDLLKQGGVLLYRLKTTSSTRLRSGDAEEKVVYHIIEEAGNVGIWIRDIRVKSNLGMTQLNKLLKQMEGKKLIKSVTSVAASRKKVYMLHDLEPHQSVTGGAWYSDQDFESEFVEVLNQQCFKFLTQRAEGSTIKAEGPLAARSMAFASSKEICEFISQLGISKVKLTVADIENILDTLIYDGKAESRVQGGGGERQKLYRAVSSLLPPVGLVKTPCGICPVIDQCSLQGSVTPHKCTYLKQWLQ